MDLVFLHGPVAVGKLTVGRALAARTGLPLFHNHLVVDAVHAVFEFGSPSFVALREAIWLSVFEEAARTDRSLIFTFAPESTVAIDFPDRAAATVAGLGGRVRFVRLTAPLAVQESRVETPSRREHGKVASLDALRSLRDLGAWNVPEPPAELTVDTGERAPEEAARLIAERLGLATA